MQWLFARLEDAREDRLSVDVYLWRRDRFLSTSGLAADEVPCLHHRCLHSVCLSLDFSLHKCLCVSVCMYNMCVSVSVHEMAFA